MRAVRLSKCLLAPALCLLGLGLAVAPAGADFSEEGFVDDVVIDGLELPTAVRFSPDGRVFVAEKSGLVKVFDDLEDDTPTVFADLRLEVHDYWDRGLLGLELDPGFPEEPYVYVNYTHDAEIGGDAPTWGTAEGGDKCPNHYAGCLVSGRVSRLTADGDAAAGPERVLVEDWCQQSFSHSVGGLAFDSSGALYAGGGEGASPEYTDYGQAGGNPCDDPPGGDDLEPPEAEGGALRSQDLVTGGDPLGLAGAIARVDPETGEGLSDNPMGSSAGENHSRLVAYGFRNPFRFAIQPGTDDLWIGDVGWNRWEELDHVPAIGGPEQPLNFGWPCYEGASRSPEWEALELDLCETLYANAGEHRVTGPFLAYPRGGDVTPEDDCTLSNGSSLSAIAFYETGGFPESYDGALFFGDYARRCIWVIPPGAGGTPDLSGLSIFEEQAGAAVDLQTGSGGDLFYVDIYDGSIHRITYFEGNRPPTARATATPAYGDLPLEVQFDASDSFDADGDELSYEWDLDGDGAFADDGVTGVRPDPVTYTEKDVIDVGLRVTETSTDENLQDTDTVEIQPGNNAPSAKILTDPETLWSTGQLLSYAGEGGDPDGDDVGLRWSITIEHCPDDCHEHFLTQSNGPNGELVAPDHEYPSDLILTLTATDSGGLKATDQIKLFPRTTTVHVESRPPGVTLTLGGKSEPAPFTRTVILGSLVQATAPATHQLEGGSLIDFLRWNDGAEDHPEPTFSFEATAPASLTAIYDWTPPGEGRGRTCSDRSPPRSLLLRRRIAIAHRGIVVRGRTADPGCRRTTRPRKPRAWIYVAYVAPRHAGGRRCRFLRPGAKYSRLRSCRRPTLLSARGFRRFGRGIRARFPRGLYLVGSLARDRAGNRERFAKRNRALVRRGLRRTSRHRRQ